MTTRLYLEGSDFGIPPITPAFAGSWNTAASAVRRHLSTSPMGSVMVSLSIAEAVATNPYDVAHFQFISPPIAAQTVSGSLKGQLRAQEASADADFRAQVVAKVVSGDGSSLTGTLLAADASALSSEFATALTNRKFPLAGISPATLSSVSANAGDRIVVEVGYRSHNSHTTSRSGTLRIGSAASSDLAEDESTTTDNRPWLEFSSDITFQDVGIRVTRELAEVVIADPTPSLRVTRVLAEVVVQRVVDVGWWGTSLLEEDELPGF